MLSIYMIVVVYGYVCTKVCEFTINNLNKMPLICNVFLKYISVYKECVDINNSAPVQGLSYIENGP